MQDVLAQIIDTKRTEIATLFATSSFSDIDKAAHAASPVRGLPMRLKPPQKPVTA